MTRPRTFSDRIDDAVRTALSGCQHEALEMFKHTAEVADCLTDFVRRRGLAAQMLEYAAGRDIDLKPLFEGAEMDLTRFCDTDSTYLKSSDLQGHEVRVVIADVEAVQFDDGTTKPVISFVGKEKRLACNKTNARRIAESYGFESDEWRGKPLILFSEKVSFDGRLVDGLRVRVPGETAQDEIPF